jgi:ketosteroid isomerase-like protein
VNTHPAISLDNDEIRMTNVEGRPKSEAQIKRQQIRSRRFGFRDSGFLRHSTFVIRISVRTAADRQSATRPTASWRYIPFAILLLLVCNGCAHVSSKPEVGAEQQVRAVLDAQVRAWNAGDLRGFMEGYARSDRTRFQSSGNVSLGWQTVFDRYQKRYGDRTRMGVLNFSEVEVTVLAPDAALAVGRWRLERAQDAPSGLFTLLFRRTPAGWRIVHDHTSAAE